MWRGCRILEALLVEEDISSSGIANAIRCLHKSSVNVFLIVEIEIVDVLYSVIRSRLKHGLIVLSVL